MRLCPALHLGRFHSRWIENLLIWNCWPLLADTLWTLMTAIHLNNPQVRTKSTVTSWGAFHGLEGTLLLSLASIIFALLIATIPMTARRILMGEYSPIGAAIAWGRGAASKVLAGTTMAAATGGTGAVAAAGAGGGGVFGQWRNASRRGRWNTRTLRRRCDGRRRRCDSRRQFATDSTTTHAAGFAGRDAVVRTRAWRSQHAVQFEVNGRRYREGRPSR